MVSAKSAAAEGASLSKKRSSRLPALVCSFVTRLARKGTCIGLGFHSLLRRRECSALDSTTHRNYPLKERGHYVAHRVRLNLATVASLCDPTCTPVASKSLVKDAPIGYCLSSHHDRGNFASRESNVDR